MRQESAVSAPPSEAPRLRLSLARAAYAGRHGNARVRRAPRRVYPPCMPVAALDNPLDLAFLVLLAFLLFGKQLPDVARSLGRGIRELRESTNFSEVSDALNSVNEVRSLATPTTIARAALPGVAEVQDTVGAAKDFAANPLGPAEAEETEEAATETPPASGAPPAS